MKAYGTSLTMECEPMPAPQAVDMDGEIYPMTGGLRGVWATAPVGRPVTIVATIDRRGDRSPLDAPVNVPAGCGFVGFENLLTCSARSPS